MKQTATDAQVKEFAELYPVVLHELRGRNQHAAEAQGVAWDANLAHKQTANAVARAVSKAAATDAEALARRLHRLRREVAAIRQTAHRARQVPAGTYYVGGSVRVIVERVEVGGYIGPTYVYEGDSVAPLTEDASQQVLARLRRDKLKPVS